MGLCSMATAAASPTPTRSSRHGARPPPARSRYCVRTHTHHTHTCTHHTHALAHRYCVRTHTHTHTHTHITHAHTHTHTHTCTRPSSLPLHRPRERGKPRLPTAELAPPQISLQAPTQCTGRECFGSKTPTRGTKEMTQPCVMPPACHLFGFGGLNLPGGAGSTGRTRGRRCGTRRQPDGRLLPFTELSLPFADLSPPFIDFPLPFTRWRSQGGAAFPWWAAGPRRRCALETKRQ